MTTTEPLVSHHHTTDETGEKGKEDLQIGREDIPSSKEEDDDKKKASEDRSEVKQSEDVEIPVKAEPEVLKHGSEEASEEAADEIEVKEAPAAEAKEKPPVEAAKEVAENVPQVIDAAIEDVMVHGAVVTEPAIEAVSNEPVEKAGVNEEPIEQPADSEPHQAEDKQEEKTKPQPKSNEAEVEKGKLKKQSQDKTTSDTNVVARVIEKSFEGEQSSKDVEVVKESTKQVVMLEEGKNGHETKTQEGNLIVKTKQSDSNNIMSKFKQSLGKVKKAITGKSPSSNPLSPETKHK